MPGAVTFEEGHVVTFEEGHVVTFEEGHVVAAGRLRSGAYLGSMRPDRPLTRSGKSLLNTIYCSAVFGNSKPVLWNCLQQTCIKQLRSQCWRNIF